MNLNIIIFKEFQFSSWLYSHIFSFFILLFFIILNWDIKEFN